jgi:hypothetical protein
MPVDGGAVGIKAVPDFEGFGALFSQGIRGALGQAEGLGKQLSSALGGGIKSGVILGTAGAAVAIGDFVAHSIQGYTRLADTTRELDAVTGASAQRSSLFAGVLKDVGVNASSAAGPLGILANNVENHTALFAKYGVQIAKTKDGNTDLLGTLDNLRQSFGGSEKATLGDAAAKELLGRGYRTLLPYLELTNTQLKQIQDVVRRSGGVINQSDVDNARQLAVNVEVAKEHIASITSAAGKAGTSVLNNFFGGLDVLSKTGVGDIPRVAAQFTVLGQVLGVDLPDHIKKAVTADQNLAKASADTTNQLKEEGIAADSLGKAIEGVHSAEEGVHSAQEGVQHAAEGVASAQEGVTKATQNYQHAVEGVQRAQEGVQKAHEGVQRAEEQLGTAQQNLNDLLAKGAVDAQAVESAQRGLDSANRQVRDSTEALAQAEQNLVEIQAFAGVDSANELTNAHLQLSQATLQLAQARFQLGTSKPTLQNPFAGVQASLAVRQAQEQQRAAQENVNKLSQFGTQSDKQLADAQKQVRDATEHVNDSLTAQADAQQKLNVAQAGDPDFQKKVADAKRQVADASLAVRDAEDGERDASLSLRDAKQAVTDATNGEHQAAQALADARQSQADADQTLTDAKIRLRDATDQVNQLIADESVKSVDLAGVLDALKVKYPELAGVIDQFYSSVVASRAKLAASQPPPTPPAGPPPGTDLRPPAQQRQSPPSSYDIQRQHGGDVVPGQTYRINEVANETVTFPASGTVHPANLTPAGGGATNITVNVAGTWDLSDPAERARVAELLARDIRGAMARDARSYSGRQ